MAFSWTMLSLAMLNSWYVILLEPTYHYYNGGVGCTLLNYFPLIKVVLLGTNSRRAVWRSSDPEKWIMNLVEEGRTSFYLTPSSYSTVKKHGCSILCGKGES